MHKIEDIQIMDRSSGEFLKKEQGASSHLRVLEPETTYGEEGQRTLFDRIETEQTTHRVKAHRVSKRHLRPKKIRSGCFQLQNRRYLGNKHKLLGLIEDIVYEKCGDMDSFCDIFAGTGVVGQHFNHPDIKIISNDLLFSNYVCLHAFLGPDNRAQESIFKKIEYLNDLLPGKENYFSINFGKTYFSEENSRKIGRIREEINIISKSENEKNLLICSLLYATDKVANTVGHYDAFRKKMDTVQPIKLLIPDVGCTSNSKNEIYREDANSLIKKISCDVLYIDPPYNSRQYSDAYHLLENLAEWKKPKVSGIGKKMNRSHIKSDYCLKNATSAFENLVKISKCKHILLSYNNTKDTKDGRSNARINDSEILRILRNKGEVEIFEKDYKAFTTGKSSVEGNAERIFYCKVSK